MGCKELTATEVYKKSVSSGIIGCFIAILCTQIVYLRVYMDSAICHWVCVSAVMDTLEWTATAALVQCYKVPYILIPRPPQTFCHGFMCNSYSLLRLKSN